MPIKRAFFLNEPLKSNCHRGGVKVSPRWKQDATAVVESRHRGDRDFCKYAPGETHYKKSYKSLDNSHTNSSLSRQTMDLHAEYEYKLVII
jgi:hypothetical protein